MFKNIAILMGGNIFSQLIPILFIPLISRLYTPEQFGILAFYLAIVTVVGGVASGKYELKAVVSSAEEANHLFFFSLMTALIVSLFFHGLIVLIKSLKPELLGEVAEYYYLLALGVFAVAAYQIITYWAVKEEMFWKLSLAKTIQSILLIMVSIVLYYMDFEDTGLLNAEIFSRFLSAIILYYLVLKASFPKSNLKKIIVAGKNNISTPLRLVPASLLNLGSKQLPIYFFTIFFGPAFAGFLMISQRLILTPLSVISNSISQVFLQKTAIEFKEKGECKKTYIIGLLLLSILAIPPMLISYFFIEKIAVLFLGAQWVGIGEFIKILIPFYYIYFIAGTLNIIIVSAGKETLNLYMQLLYAIITSAMILLIFYFKLSQDFALILYSVAMGAYFLISLFVTYSLSSGGSFEKK